MTDSLSPLQRATKLVAVTYNGPHCAEAAADLEVGERMGYDLEARPVLLFAVNLGTGQSVASGEYGRAFGQNFLSRYGSVTLGGEFEGGTAFQRHAGHMIVVSDKHELLLDPTFAQFQQLCDPAVALFASETLLRKTGRFWHVGGEDFFPQPHVCPALVERRRGPNRSDALLDGDLVCNISPCVETSGVRGVSSDKE